MRLGEFEEQQYGARVATIREGNNAVEIKDNRNGTYDLTVFYMDEETAQSTDLTAYALRAPDIQALRRAVDAIGLALKAHIQAGNA